MSDEKDNIPTTPDNPPVPQFPTDRTELNDTPVIPTFPSDRIEKGEISGDIHRVE